jgi:hypothetical protein
MVKGLEIKLDLLKKDGEGFSKAEVVTDLSQKYHVSPRDIYHYYENMAKWLPEILGYQNAKQHWLRCMARLETIYSAAGFYRFQGSSDVVRIQALKIQLECVRTMITKSGFDYTRLNELNAETIEDREEQDREKLVYEALPDHVKHSIAEYIRIRRETERQLEDEGKILKGSPKGSNLH